MKQCLIIPILICSLLQTGCKNEDPDLPRYVLLKTNEKMIIDGNLDESSWQKADLIQFRLNDTGGTMDDSALLTVGKG
mgnify:CR=1 FL=1